MNLAKSTMWVFAAKVLASILSFTAVIVFSRRLGAAPLGVYYPFLALLGILAIPADLGIRSAAEKRISEGKEASAFLGTAIALKIPPLVAISGAILFFGGYVNQYLGENLAELLVITLFVNEIGRFGLFVLRGELRVGETAIAEIIRPLGWLTIGYLLITQGYGVYGLVYGYLAGTTALTAVVWWKISTPIGFPSTRHIQSIYEYGRFSLVSSVGGYFYGWMDVAILTLFVSLGVVSTRGEIGAYENAWRLSLVVTLFSRAIAVSLFPQISRWDAENATDRIEKVLPKAILPILLLVIPAFAGTVVLAKDLLSILFGAEFTLAWLALIILTGEKILQSLHIVLGRSLQAIDRPDLAAFATAFSIIINLILNVVLIWHFGIVGAAIATTASFTVNTVLHASYLNRFIRIKLPIREAIWVLFASAVMGGFVYGLQSISPIESPSHLLAVIVSGMVVYSLFALAYPPLRSAIRPAIQQISPIRTH